MKAVSAALLLILLGACAGGPSAPQRPLAPAHVEAGAIVGGARLALSSWAPEGRPRAVILALHGFADYGPSTFAGAASFWARRGFLTYAYDQRGFGRNESRGQWPGAARLVVDFREVAALIRARHPGLPLFVIGHSMGGAVALAGFGEGVAADGLVLAAPAVWGGDRLPARYRAAAWTAALLFPDHRWTGDGVITIQASDNIPLLIKLGRDPLYLSAPSSRELLGLVRLMDAAVAAAPRVCAPVLTLYGEKDQVAPKEAVLAAHDALSGPKTLRLYEEGWHLLFRDLDARRVWRDVAAWMEARS
ncbi:alpha/beta fold hydrolase [Pikeienuella sp. HZG-20]|uniref:alpha/beta fold hydrolase n=1 Tax=Paludibacillus litoralis TaxID=3133267 RepID=UPI0030EEE58C